MRLDTQLLQQIIAKGLLTYRESLVLHMWHELGVPQILQIRSW